MPFLDPNELFGWIPVCNNVADLERLSDEVGKRIQALATSKMGPAAHGLMGPGEGGYVQPTDHNQPLAVPRMMTGPRPAFSGTVSLQSLVELNKRREEAQKGDLRGPGPDPVNVDLGIAPQATRERTAGVLEELARATRQETMKDAGVTPKDVQTPEAQGKAPATQNEKAAQERARDGEMAEGVPQGEEAKKAVAPQRKMKRVPVRG
jgi:hypothetical protein